MYHLAVPIAQQDIVVIVDLMGVQILEVSK